MKTKKFTPRKSKRREALEHSATIFRKFHIAYEPSELYHLNDLKKITSSISVFEFMTPIMEPIVNVKEEFYVLCLNNQNKVVGYSKISEGGITGTIVDIRLVAKIALDCLATSIILCHNHPSGKVSPSISDKNMTKKIKEGFEALDIRVLDHLIITENSYLSFADEGIL